MQVVRHAACSAYVELLAEGVPLSHQCLEVAEQRITRLQQQSLLLRRQPQALLQAQQNLHVLMGIKCRERSSNRPLVSSTLCRGLMGAVDRTALHCNLTRPAKGTNGVHMNPCAPVLVLHSQKACASNKPRESRVLRAQWLGFRPDGRRRM